MALLAPAVGGCVGLAAVVRGSETLVLERPAVFHPLHGGASDSAGALRALWGAPDAVDPQPDGGAVWRWRGGLRLPGVAVLLGVVPLPLLLPTGRHDVAVRVREGRIVSARGSRNVTRFRVGCVVALGVEFVGASGCAAGSGGHEARRLGRRGAELVEPAARPLPRPAQPPPPSTR